MISFEKIPNPGQLNIKERDLLRKLVLTARDVPPQEDASLKGGHSQLKAVLPNEYTAIKVYLLTDIERLKTSIPYIKCEIEIKDGDPKLWPKYFLWLDLKPTNTSPYGKVTKIAAFPPPPDK